MTLQISTSNDIIIDGQITGLKLTQRQDRTVVYTPESLISGRASYEHKMPFVRYSTVHAAPCKVGASYDPNICAGCEQLESDVLKLLKTLGTKNSEIVDDSETQKNLSNRFR